MFNVKELFETCCDDREWVLPSTCRCSILFRNNLQVKQDPTHDTKAT